MEGQRQVNGDVEALHVGTGLGAASEVVHPQTAVAVVIGVVVGAVGGRVDAVGYAGPLHVVAGTLEVARIAAGHRHEVEARLVGVAVGDGSVAVAFAVLLDMVAVAHACNVAHAAAEAHGIGRDDLAAFLRHIAQFDTALLSFGEGEGAEIDPRAAAHGLVDGERSGAAFVTDGVAGVAGALGQGLIAHIDSVVAVLRDVWRPGDGAALIGFLHGCGHAVGSVGEGILKIDVLLSEIGEACAVAFLPGVEAVVLGVGRRGECPVVVNDHLIGIGVSLTRHHHVGARVLEHRHEVGQHEALGELVLNALKEAGALPLPAVKSLFEVFAMALPKGDVAVLQAALQCVGPVEVADDGGDGVACLAEALGRYVAEAGNVYHIAAARTVVEGYEAMDVVAIDEDRELLVLQVGGQLVGKGLGDVGHVVGAHGHVLQCAVKKYFDAVGSDGRGVNGYLPDVDTLRETLQGLVDDVVVKVKGLCCCCILRACREQVDSAYTTSRHQSYS